MIVQRPQCTFFFLGKEFLKSCFAVLCARAFHQLDRLPLNSIFSTFRGRVTLTSPLRVFRFSFCRTTASYVSSAAPHVYDCLVFPYSSGSYIAVAALSSCLN
ncbi:PREDICTED: uncharacterized protein LOC108362959 [Rhagoletis zephyria]|uniref:uncharacterized protein LOC108362959 n=1 Tax=Rhagoletis zephyria TaxID=28612 RepID=UPI00081145D1|nr:PREDICTED: uncharacterized protein LOC108362959 [Rhagoletis zephyria]